MTESHWAERWRIDDKISITMNFKKNLTSAQREKSYLERKKKTKWHFSTWKNSEHITQDLPQQNIQENIDQTPSKPEQAG